MRTTWIAGMALLASLVAPAAWAQTEGIKVHGAWVIEVRNPDGTLASRHEFQNALTAPGGGAMAALLSRTQSPGLWWITFGRRFVSTCFSASNNLANCSITEPARLVAPGEAHWLSNNLTVRAEGGSVILAGTVTFPIASNFTDVSTMLSSCAATTAPTACAPSGGAVSFSHKEIPSVSVSAGQIVQVQVTFSFS